MTDMPERVWVGLARELDSNSRQVREIRYWGRSKFSNDCVQYTRTPDPLLEKMVEALRGMHEGEYITQDKYDADWGLVIRRIVIAVRRKPAPSSRSGMSGRWGKTPSDD
jgi:hypothetical protein